MYLAIWNCAGHSDSCQQWIHLKESVFHGCIISYITSMSTESTHRSKGRQPSFWSLVFDKTKNPILSLSLSLSKILNWFHLDLCFKSRRWLSTACECSMFSAEREKADAPLQWIFPKKVKFPFDKRSSSLKAGPINPKTLFDSRVTFLQNQLAHAIHTSFTLVGGSSPLDESIENR